jgi:IS605 OrfB family transposase
MMARSSGIIISVKVPIKMDVMTKRTKQRLRQIVGRDTRVIRAFLGIIELHEDELLKGRKKTKIDDGKLKRLTLTAIKVKTGHNQRVTVPHDMKSRFPRISANELQECCETAVFMYESYLELRRKKGYNASRPCAVNSTRRIPRWVYRQRFRLIEHNTTVSRWWLDIRDSLDSAPARKSIHDRLLVPLKISPFHLNQIQRGNLKALQIFVDRYMKWWITLSIRVNNIPQVNSDSNPAVLGIDLGIEKAVCTSLVTPTKVRESKYFTQPDKVKKIKNLDHRVAILQRELDTRKNNGQEYDKLSLKLRTLRGKRERVAKEYDSFLVRRLFDYILKLSQKYDLYVAIGRLKNIRMVARRGNYKGQKFRGMVHRWSFARITESLKRQLSVHGIPVDGNRSRFKVIPESWTSKMCWKCGHKGRRPKQNYFVCPTCGNRTNADRNGAINIAGRLITLTKLLHSVRGLGKWADSVFRAGKRSRLKTRGKTHSSRRGSLLSSKGVVSDLGESAVVHSAQMSLLDFGDGVKESDQDHAVVKDAETLSVADSDTIRARQEKEARTAGGIPSQ